VASEALELAAGQVSAPVEDGGAWYVIQTTAKTESSIPPLAEVSASVRAGVAKQKAAEAARAQAAKLLEAARGNGNLTAAAKAAGLAVVTTGLFERKGAEVPNLGPAPAVVEAAFKLTKEKPFPAEPIVLGDDAVVTRLVERQAADPAGDAEGLARVRRALERDKADTAFRQLVETRRREGDIWVNPQFAPPPGTGPVAQRG
jgi:peptidyl-prolyl cis-trans isomerase D